MIKLKFKKTTNVNGTSLVGYVNTSYNKLVEVFGEPCLHNNVSTMDKVTIEWRLRFDDGTIATIYDWKGYGHQPTGDELYDWHIGAHYSEAHYLVKEALGI